MSEYVTLVGAEDVQRAARTMISAAENMQAAANSLDHSLITFLSQFEELVTRMEACMRPKP